MSEKDKYCMIALTMWILKNYIKEIYIYIHTHTHTYRHRKQACGCQRGEGREQGQMRDVGLRDYIHKIEEQ